MSEYTPTVEEVLDSIVYLNKYHAKQYGDVDLMVVGSETAAQFRRMIAAIEREAAARALAEVKAKVWIERSVHGNGYPNTHYGGMVHAYRLITSAEP